LFVNEEITSLLGASDEAKSKYDVSVQRSLRLDATTSPTRKDDRGIRALDKFHILRPVCEYRWHASPSIVSQPNEKRRRFAAIWGKKHEALERDESDFGGRETKTHAQICTPPFHLPARRHFCRNLSPRNICTAEKWNNSVFMYSAVRAFLSYGVRGRRRSCVCRAKSLLMSFYFMLTIKRARAPLKRLIARLSEKSSLCIIGSHKIPNFIIKR
jgi:hypothetical protein